MERETLLAWMAVGAVAMLALVIAWMAYLISGGASVDTSDDIGSTVVFADTDVSCKDGKTFKLTTGTIGGHCLNRFDEAGNATGGECKDGENQAFASCTKNSGDGSCLGSKGKGKCGEKK